jgi:hypothetical protein
LKILAIDPGNIESAFVVMNNKKPETFGKLDNETILAMLDNWSDLTAHLVIEKIASYGMSVGKEVFDTCIWSGRFWEAFKGQKKNFVYRKDVKINLCGSMRAKDTNIIQALKDRFGGKGTLKNPGWFYGFRKDIWQAYAVGITYYDTREIEGKE